MKLAVGPTNVRLSPALRALLLIILSLVAAGCFATLWTTLSKRLDVVAERSGEMIESQLAPWLASAPSTSIKGPLEPLLGAEKTALRFVRVVDANGRRLGSVSRAGRFAGLFFRRADKRTRERVENFFAANYLKSLSNHGVIVGHAHYGIDYSVMARAQDGAGWTMLLAALVGLVLSVSALPRLLAGMIRDRRRVLAESPDDTVLKASPANIPLTGAGNGAQPTFFETLVDALNHLEYAFLLTDPKGCIRYVNSAAEALLGWGFKEVLDKPVHAILHTLDETQEVVASPAERCLQGEQRRVRAELDLKPKVGTPFPVRIYAASVLSVKGEAEGTVTILEDMRPERAYRAAFEAQLGVWATAVDGLEDGLLWLKSNGTIENANAPAARLLGYSRAELIGKCVGAVIPIPFETSPETVLERYAQGDPAMPRREVIAKRQDGVAFPAEIRLCALDYRDERFHLLLFRDLTSQRRRETLRARLGRILDLTADEIYVIAAGSLRIEEASLGASSGLGYSVDELSGLSYTQINREIDLKQYERYLSALSSGQKSRISLRTQHTRKNGEQYPVDLRLALAPDEPTPVFLALAQDVSEQQKSEMRLSYLAHHDALTGLPNRVLFMDRLQQAVLAADRTKRMFGLIFVDLDKFKQINDTLGHEVGDIYLQGVAERLTSAVRSADTVARLSGDEFTVIVSGLSDRKHAVGIVENILSKLDEPVEAAGRQLRIRASLGVTLYPLDGGSPEDLLQHADVAMYGAKQEGGQSYRFYEKTMNDQARTRSSQQSALRADIENGRLELLFQPFYNLRSGAIAGAEVIAFWSGPDGEKLGQPLLDLINELRLQTPFKVWLMQAVHKQIADWRNIAAPAIPLIVRACSGTGNRGMGLKSLFTDVELEAFENSRLVLDLSCPEALEDMNESSEILSQLKAYGVRICVSDRTPGATEIGRLVQAPIDMLRISASTMKGAISGSAQGLKYLNAVMGLARSIGLPTLAQGVMNEDQARIIRTVNDQGYVQGDLLCKTMSPRTFMDKVKGAPIEPF